MENDYSEEHQRKGKTDYEFLKDRMRNYLSPFITYFELKKMYDNEEISEDKKDNIKKFLKTAEKQCSINIKKIKSILEGD
jgi:outer membrane protein TolC